MGGERGSEGCGVRGVEFCICEGCGGFGVREAPWLLCYGRGVRGARVAVSSDMYFFREEC